MVDIELVGVVGEVLVVFLVLFLGFKGVLGGIVVLRFVFFEIVGVIAWIVLDSLLRTINRFIWLFYSIGFIIFLLLFIILVEILLLFFYFLMSTTTVICNVYVFIDLFCIFSLLFSLFFLFCFFSCICKPSKEVYSLCIAQRNILSILLCNFMNFRQILSNQSLQIC